MKLVKPLKKNILLCAKVLKKGGILICPTDTVYGFLADATNKKAVANIYKIKKRPKSKSLPVFIKDLKMAKSLADIDNRQENMLRKFWPGKYTCILKLKVKSQKLKVFGVSKDTIALRIPKYQFLNNLLKKINRPLVQTSVNISAQAPLKNIEAILATFGKNKLVDLIIDGQNAKNSMSANRQIKPSKIIDLTSKKLARLR